MATRRIGKSAIDWAAFAARVPEGQKQFFQMFKSRSDEYMRKVNTFPEHPPQIDWNYYRSRIVVSGLVDELEKSFKSLNVLYPTENVTPEIDNQQKEAEKKTQEFVMQSNARIAECQKELDWLHGLLPFDQMTMEDFRDAFPDQALDPINRPTWWPHQPIDVENSPPK